MISKNYLEYLQTELQNIKNEGLYKNERIITSQQSAEIVANGKNYLTSVPITTSGYPTTPKL